MGVDVTHWAGSAEYTGLDNKTFIQIANKVGYKDNDVFGELRECGLDFQFDGSTLHLDADWSYGEIRWRYQGDLFVALAPYAKDGGYLEVLTDHDESGAGATTFEYRGGKVREYTQEDLARERQEALSELEGLLGDNVALLLLGAESMLLREMGQRLTNKAKEA